MQITTVRSGVATVRLDKNIFKRKHFLLTGGLIYSRLVMNMYAANSFKLHETEPSRINGINE